MSKVSPTLEGFRVAFRRPSFTLAEITWRWCFGAVAWSLLLFGFFEYLDSLPVTNGEARLLWTRQPALVTRALEHILRGSLSRTVFSLMLAALGLTAFWIIAGAVGRIATVSSLLDFFRNKFSLSDWIPEKKSWPLRAIAGLNFLRAATALASVLALIGGSILAGFVSSPAKLHTGLAFLLFVSMATIICALWLALNWLLSLASIFAVRDCENTPGSLVLAVSFLREHFGALWAVSSWTGLAHLTAFSIATTAASFPLAFLPVAPHLVKIAVLIVTLAYFGVADWLYIARLGGYVCIAEMPAPALVSPTLSAAGPVPGSPVSAAVDRDETILSDLPGLALET